MGINKKGNTGRIAGIQPVVFPIFETLGHYNGGAAYIFTKHYTSFFMNLSISHDYLFKFLVYRAKMGGLIKYSTDLLKIFKLFVEHAQAHHDLREGYQINCSVQKSREYFEDLVKLSVLIPAKEKQEFLINPCIVFHRDLQFTVWYQFTEKYIWVAKNETLSIEEKAKRLKKITNDLYTEFMITQSRYRPIKINKI